ncbi:amidohydrolase family protein [Candidatus Bipolaricaulota sp. J31]
MRGPVVYRNATVLVGEELRPLPQAYIAVEEGIITDIGTGPAPRGEDLAGAVVMPAFVNAHTHLADAGFKDGAVGLPTEEAVSPPHGLKYRYLAELSLQALVRVLQDALTELSRNGIGAFGDFREGGVTGTVALREAMKGIPVAGVVFADPVSPPGDPGFADEVQELVGLPAVDGIGIGDIALFDDVQLVRLRQSLGKKMLAVHVAETRKAQRRCQRRWGKSEVERVLEHGADLLVHLTNPTRGDLELVARAHVPVVCCARTNCILGDGVPPVYELVRRDVPLALGTDNVMFTGPDMFREMDWFSRLVRGQARRADAISSREVLSIATLGGARALRLEGRLGTLEPGKWASFVAVDFSTLNLRTSRDIHAALVHRAGPEDVALVVLRGHEVFRRAGAPARG